MGLVPAALRRCRPCLTYNRRSPLRRWRNGRLDGLKSHCPKGRVGSNPTRRMPVRDVEDVAAALDLIERGLNDSEVSRRLSIPRTTVRGWRLDGIPTRCRGETCRSCEQPAHDFAALPGAYGYLLGLYLGDGYIASYPRGVFALRIYLDGAYPGIVNACWLAVAQVAPRRKASVGWSKRARMATVASYSREWPCLLPQHGPGRKHERAIRLTEWQRDLITADPRPLVRGLIHSDGSRFMNRVKVRGRRYEYPRYNFTNASADIRTIFCGACASLGVEWRQMNSRTVSVAHRDSVELLDSFVGPKA